MINAISTDETIKKMDIIAKEEKRAEAGL